MGFEISEPSGVMLGFTDGFTVGVGFGVWVGFGLGVGFWFSSKRCGAKISTVLVSLFQSTVTEKASKTALIGTQVTPFTITGGESRYLNPWFISIL